MPESIVNHLGKLKLNLVHIGFLKGKSSLTNLLDFSEDVTGRGDRGEPYDIMYLDLQKAFDMV